MSHPSLAFEKGHKKGTENKRSIPNCW